MIDSTAIAVAKGFCTQEAEVGGAEHTVDLEATMDADLDTLCTVVYCTADDLLPRAAANARREVTDAEVVTLCVAQAIMGILKRPPVPEGRPQAARAPVWQAARPIGVPQAPASHGGHDRVADGGLRGP